MIKAIITTQNKFNLINWCLPTQYKKDKGSDYSLLIVRQMYKLSCTIDDCFYRLENLLMEAATHKADESLFRNKS